MILVKQTRCFTPACKLNAKSTDVLLVLSDVGQIHAMQTPDELVELWQRTFDEMKKEGAYARLVEKFNFHPSIFSDHPRTDR